MSNIHWDYAEAFTGKEAAYLIAGFNPSSNSPDDLYNSQPIIKRMKAAYYSACSDFRFDFDHAMENDKLMFSRCTKSAGNLLSVELQKLVWHYENSDYVTSGKSFIGGFIFDDPEDPDRPRQEAIMPLINWEMSDDHEFGDQVFDRRELSRWLAENNLPTQYKFAPPATSNLTEVYPWGMHNTKLLSKLSEAAKRFWGLYDPADKTTAPTNEQVEEWLVGEGISKRIAEVMATILRKDGLPTGRRE